MKRRITITAVVLAHLAVAGCAGTHAEPTNETVTAAATTEAPEADPGNDAAFLDHVRYAGPLTLARNDDPTILDLAHRTCARLDEGMTTDEIARIIYTSSDPTVQEDAMFVVGAAIGWYCPQYIEDL